MGKCAEGSIPDGDHQGPRFESRGQPPAGQSRPSPAMAVSTKRFAFGSAERHSVTVTEVFRDFTQL